MTWKPKFKVGQHIKWAGHPDLLIIDINNESYIFKDENGEKFDITGTTIDNGLFDRNHTEPAELLYGGKIKNRKSKRKTRKSVRKSRKLKRKKSNRHR
jgi:hypothetical protein